MELVPMEQQLGLIPKIRFDLNIPAHGLEFGQPLAGPRKVTQFPGITRHEIGNGVNIRKSFDPRQQFQVRVQGAIQFVEAVRQAKPAARSVGEHLCEQAREVTGRFPISEPALDLPTHNKDLRVKTIQSANSVHFRFGFDGFAQSEPAESRVQVVPFGKSQYLHELCRYWHSPCQMTRRLELTMSQSVETIQESKVRKSLTGCIARAMSMHAVETARTSASWLALD